MCGLTQEVVPFSGATVSFSSPTHTPSYPLVTLKFCNCVVRFPGRIYWQEQDVQVGEGEHGAISKD